MNLRPAYQRPLQFVDTFLNGLTMYRLVLYGLGALAAIAITFSFMGALDFSATALLLTWATLLIICLVTSWLFAMLTDAPANTESSAITALILFFLVLPATNLRSLTFVALAGVVAIASKYLLALRHRHIFNPAALAAAALGLTALYPATWWVATPILLPFTLALGLLITRKLRRFRLVGVFLITALAVMLAMGLVHSRSALEVIITAFTSWPLIFFGTIMLTEPSTVPAKPIHQMVYGGLVGLIFASQVHLGFLYSSPEVALIIGNLLAYFASPRPRLRLQLSDRVELSERLFELRFTADRPIKYRPGQYLEFTMPHPGTDSRGNRRTFSLASSPTEQQLRLGIKLYQPSSSFKTALRGLKPGAIIAAGQLAGSFTLPTDPNEKLIFVAGGIGVTPFRSMVKYLVDRQEARDIVLFYLVTDPSEAVYRDVFAAAASLGVKLVILVKEGLNAEHLASHAPDFKSRHVFISGPNPMVDHYRQLLRDLGVPRRKISTDYFSGY